MAPATQKRGTCVTTNCNPNVLNNPKHFGKKCNIRKTVCNKNCDASAESVAIPTCYQRIRRG
eukprot:7821038-Pyramimonas_sp.AAC.1